MFESFLRHSRVPYIEHVLSSFVIDAACRGREPSTYIHRLLIHPCISGGKITPMGSNHKTNLPRQVCCTIRPHESKKENLFLLQVAKRRCDHQRNRVMFHDCTQPRYVELPTHVPSPRKTPSSRKLYTDPLFIAQIPHTNCHPFYYKRSGVYSDSKSAKIFSPFARAASMSPTM